MEAGTHKICQSTFFKDVLSYFACLESETGSLLPARLYPVYLRKSGRVDDEKQSTGDVASPTHFHPRHVRFASKVPFQSN